MCSITEPVNGKGPYRFLARSQPARGRRIAGSPVPGEVDAIVLWFTGYYYYDYGWRGRWPASSLTSGGTTEAPRGL